MERMTLAKKVNQENLSLEAELVIVAEKKRYPFELHMELGQCKVLKKDYDSVPKEVWEETMKELLPNKKVEFVIM